MPGPVTSPLAEGANALLHDGAHVIRDAQDALDVACGVGVRSARRARTHTAVELGLRALLEARRRRDTTRWRRCTAMHGADDAMVGLADLELRGLVRRETGGRYLRVL